MTDTDESTTDGETEEFTNKHLNQELVGWMGFIAAIQLWTFGVLLVAVLDQPLEYLGVFPIAAGCVALLLVPAVNGNRYARRFFEATNNEQIDWDEELPEVDA